jgi:hypothetical protein
MHLLHCKRYPACKYHFLNFHDRLIKCFACSHWKCHPIPNNFDVSIHSSKTNLQNIFLVSFCKSGSFTDVFDNKLVLYLNIIKTFHFYIFLIPSHLLLLYWIGHWKDWTKLWTTEIMSRCSTCNKSKFTTRRFRYVVISPEKKLWEVHYCTLLSTLKTNLSASLLSPLKQICQIC